MNFKQGAFSARNIATLGVLTALVFVFQFLAPYLNIGGTSFALVLVPIVMGAMLIGPWAGAFLGFVFSTIVFLCGLFGMDPFFTSRMININWFLTFLIIYLKGIMAGLVPGLIFKWLREKNKHLAVFISSISAPIVNTGIFLLGSLLTQNVFLKDFPEFMTIVLSMAIFINFLVELAINIIANPAIYTVVKVIEKKK